MKNKGRRQRAFYDSELTGAINNCKGFLVRLTRPISSMSSKGMAYGRYDKKKWQKRVRGYFKSQTKDVF